MHARSLPDVLDPREETVCIYICTNVFEKEDMLTNTISQNMKPHIQGHLGHHMNETALLRFYCSACARLALLAC